METKDQAPQNDLAETKRKVWKEVGYSDAVSDLGNLALEQWPNGIPDEVFHLIGKMTMNVPTRYEK